jgi:transposase-like protein
MVVFPCSGTAYAAKEAATYRFDYPPDIRRGIYMTNAIESAYMVGRKPTKNRPRFLEMKR